jgi:SAM-dependent methyltransferase
LPIVRDDLFRLHQDLETRHWWFVGRRRIMREVVDRALRASPAGVAVDIGCGTGANIASLADRFEPIGIDSDARAIELAAASYPQARFLCGEAPDDLGELAGRASLWLLMDVLEHVVEDRELLSRLVAAARPGAHLLLTVPTDPSLWSEHDVSFGHVRRYTADGFASLWRDLPVSVRLFSHCNTRLLPAARLVRAFAARRGRATGRAGTDFSLPPTPINAALTQVFAGEARKLVAAIDAGGRRRAPAPHPFRRGLSAIALLRREA